jgi:hypothetical protein
MEREGRKRERDGESRRAKMSGENGLFWGKKAFSEPKLLPVIHALLTTTGCGHQTARPQPMVLTVFTVK